MLCKNCNYILTGKENFCPNCASPLNEKASQTLKSKDEQQEKEQQNKQVTKREFIFPEKEEKGYEVMKDARIFYEPPEPEKSERQEPKKGYAGRIMLLLFLLCAVTAGFFGVADYFDITPSVFSFLSQTTTQEGTGTTSLFSHESSIIKPDITYTPERAYIMSGEGMSLRKGPGNCYAPVETLSDLTAVVIYGGSINEKGWVYVYCAEKKSYGWLDGSFLARDYEQETTLFAENYIAEEGSSEQNTTDVQ